MRRATHAPDLEATVDQRIRRLENAVHEIRGLLLLGLFALILLYLLLA